MNPMYAFLLRNVTETYASKGSIATSELHICNRPMSYRHFLPDETIIQTRQCYTMLCSGGDSLFYSVGSQRSNLSHEYSFHLIDSICYNELHLQKYNFSQSTEENYQISRHHIHRFSLNLNPGLEGLFMDSRMQLDYAYHSYYDRHRQRLQDSIIESFMRTHVVNHEPSLLQPWIVFTAGAMGSGKSYTIRYLQSVGRFPLNFITVDPDEIRRCIPEFYLYLQSYSYSSLAGEMTRKEAGYVAEIMILEALKRGHAVLVDGTLRDAEWYTVYFEKLRHLFKKPMLRIAIIHITAPTPIVFQRAENRAKDTGRIVPHDILLHSMETVPKSVKVLAPLADFFVELHNPSNNPLDISIVTPNMNWSLFKDIWR